LNGIFRHEEHQWYEKLVECRFEDWLGVIFAPPWQLFKADSLVFLASGVWLGSLTIFSVLKPASEIIRVDCLGACWHPKAVNMIVVSNMPKQLRIIPSLS